MPQSASGRWTIGAIASLGMALFGGSAAEAGDCIKGSIGGSQPNIGNHGASSARGTAKRSGHPSVGLIEPALQSDRTAGGSTAGPATKLLAVNFPARASTTRPFGLKLLEAVLKDRPGKNVLLSPYSAHIVLSMAMSGAKGTTREEMASLLNLSGLTEKAADEKAQSMIKSFMADKASNTIDVANAIFADTAINVNPAYAEKCRKYYSSEARSLPFQAPSSLTEINKWCSTKTHGKIPAILETLQKTDGLVLINAVYFKGDWFEKFSREKTMPEPFHLQNGSTKQVAMMRRTDSIDYFKTSGFSCICLPYEGEQLFMMVILPDEGKTIEQVLSLLSAQFPQKFNWTNVELTMPRFKVESMTKLPRYLQKLGMVSAFDAASADFSFITPAEKKTHVSEVIQKTFMSVDEEGTEAAAATAISMPKGIEAPPRHQVAFTVDRPFLVAIVHDEINELLFLGAINDP